mmetsp:Transcript_22715/g.33540  ORF Transcript_22715/g.33540 Transcript_22715/m.33540 type:complete len:123 (+) Transcript_22715:428-796(+)
MKQTRAQSITSLKRLREKSLSYCLFIPLDDFIQWKEVGGDVVVAEMANEILASEAQLLSEKEKHVVRSFRDGIKRMKGQVAANMERDTHQQAESLRQIFKSYSISPYAVAPGVLERPKGNWY